MAAFDIYLVPFSHLDLFWLGRREECLSRGCRIITAAIDLATRYGDFRFLLEDMVFVDHYLDVHPEQAEALRELVHQGRIEVGAKWAGVYQQWQTEESMARNALYGKQSARRHFDVDPDTVHMGDLPGHVPQFAQLLASAGIKGLVICRGGPDDQVLFRWLAPDGSSVLMWNAVRGYPWSWWVWLHRSVDEALQARVRRGRLHQPLDQDARQVMALTPAPILMHWGMDLAVPPERLIEAVSEWNDRVDLPMRFATLSEYFDSVAEVAGVPELSGEIVSVWPGMEAAEAGFFYLTSPANYALTEGEAWSELARRLGLGDYDAGALGEGWKLALQGMDHNWGGTGGDDTDRRHREYLMRAQMIGQDFRRRATGRIVEHVRQPEVDDVTPIVVFNSCGWTRTDIVTAHVSYYGAITAFYGPGSDYGDAFETVQLYDHMGQVVPFQYLHKATPVTREATICFTAHDIPPYGYRLYYLRAVPVAPPSVPCASVTGLDGDTVVLETERFRIEVDRPRSSVSVVDRAAGAQVVADAELVAYEADGVFSVGTGDSLHNAIDEVRVEENGPARARLVIDGWIGKTRTRQEWIVPGELDYVEVVDAVEWGGHPSWLRIQRAMTIAVEDPRVVYGLPFGSNAWDNRLPGSGPHLRDEMHAGGVECRREPLHWIDVSNGDYGVTIATERHGVQRVGKRILVDLVTASDSRPPTTAWGNGVFVTRSRLRRHSGDWIAAQSYHAGLASMLPLFAMMSADPSTPKRLPPVAGLCGLGAENVVLTTIKKAEDGNGTAVRGYEVAGLPAKAKPVLVSGPHTWAETDLMEENPTPVQDTVVWRPFEIKTLKATEHT